MFDIDNVPTTISHLTLSVNGTTGYSLSVGRVSVLHIEHVGKRQKFGAPTP